MHSSVNIANEYVSECAVGESPPFSRSSGAENLTSLDDIAPDIESSVMPSTTLAIPKSQIWGLPSPAMGDQPVVYGLDVTAELTSSEMNTFFCIPSVNRLSQKI